MSRTRSSRRRPSASHPKPVQNKPVQTTSLAPKPAARTPIPQSPRQRELTTKRLGELAEIAFALKAYKLGFGVCKPYGDSERYDVIVDSRDLRRKSNSCPPYPAPPLWRVQVKCSTQLCNGLYRINAHRRANGRAVPYLPGEIDFFAAYIVPEDTWYIIPLHAARGVTSLLFRRCRDRRPGLYDAYREAWPLLRPKPK
jgi:PD-(D/E)XK endonuclease